jgi:5-aminolevulinate synthase
MSGSIAPIKKFIDLAKKYKAQTFIDEVHAVGLYGKRGAGVAEQENLMNEIDFIVGTLGKVYFTSIRVSECSEGTSLETSSK